MCDPQWTVYALYMQLFLILSYLQLVLRFANRLFLPLWNRDNIANVQVRSLPRWLQQFISLYIMVGCYKLIPHLLSVCLKNWIKLMSESWNFLWLLCITCVLVCNESILQIVFKEDFGTDGRGGYFDQYGYVGSGYILAWLFFA